MKGQGVRSITLTCACLEGLELYEIGFERLPERCSLDPLNSSLKLFPGTIPFLHYVCSGQTEKPGEHLITIETEEAQQSLTALKWDW